MSGAAHVKPAALLPAYGLRGILRCETLEKKPDLVQQVKLIQKFLSTPSEDWSLSYGPVCGAAGNRNM